MARPPSAAAFDLGHVEAGDSPAKRERLVSDLPITRSPDLPMIPIRESAGAVTFSVRVHPRARKDALTGVHGDALKLSLTAPPVEGRANDAVVDFFAGVLRLPRSSITIAAGQTSRNKVVRVAGTTAAALVQRLAPLLKDESS